MIIIEIQPLDNGAHRNQTVSGDITPPEGWAVISFDLDMPNFPFGDIKVDYTQNPPIVTKWIPIDLPDTSHEEFLQAQQEKQIELSNQCNQIITSGIDVKTTQGIEHFSLTETDQINLTNATLAINQGATAYPYHADGQMCRMFTAEELQDIGQTAIEFKIYQTTLCNHLLTWARRVTTIEELQQITYSADNLPEDLALNMQNVLAASASL